MTLRSAVVTLLVRCDITDVRAESRVTFVRSRARVSRSRSRPSCTYVHRSLEGAVTIDRTCDHRRKPLRGMRGQENENGKIMLLTNLGPHRPTFRELCALVAHQRRRWLTISDRDLGSLMELCKVQCARNHWQYESTTLGCAIDAVCRLDATNDPRPVGSRPGDRPPQRRPR